MMDYSLEMNTTAYADFKLIYPTTVGVLKDGILKHLGNNGDGNCNLAGTIQSSSTHSKTPRK